MDGIYQWAARYIYVSLIRLASYVLELIILGIISQFCTVIEKYVVTSQVLIPRILI